MSALNFLQLGLLLLVWIFAIFCWRRQAYAVSAFSVWASWHYLLLPMGSVSHFDHSDDALETAAMYFAGYMACFTAFALALQLIERRDAAVRHKELGVRWLVGIALLHLVSMVYARLFGYSGFGGDQEVGALAGLAGTIDALGPFVFAGLGFAIGRGQGGRYLTLFALTILGINLGFAMFAMFRGQLVIPLAALLVGYAVASGRHGRTAVFVALAGVLFFFVITPFVDAMRVQTGLRAATLDDIFAAIVRMGTLQQAPEVTRLGRELNDWLVLIVGGGYPSVWAFAEYFSSGIMANLPSFIAPNKPMLAFGNDFGHQVFAIQSMDDVTNIAPGVAAEAWMFGFAGVIVFSALHAALLTYFEVVMRRITYGFALGIVLTSSGLLEMPFAHGWIAMLKLAVFVHLIWWFDTRAMGSRHVTGDADAPARAGGWQGLGAGPMGGAGPHGRAGPYGGRS